MGDMGIPNGQPEFKPEIDGYTSSAKEISDALSLLRQNDYPLNNLALWIDFNPDSLWLNGKEKGAIELHFGYFTLDNPVERTPLTNVRSVFTEVGMFRTGEYFSANPRHIYNTLEACMEREKEGLVKISDSDPDLNPDRFYFIVRRMVTKVPKIPVTSN